ncbi:MAG: heme exporter protein CcmB [Candidatus Hydrothermarchaeaceae archaeon]
MNLRSVVLVARKDLLVEARSRQTISFMFLFSFVILVMFNFGAENPFAPAVRDIAPGFLWFVFIFAGLLGLSRAFVKEKETGTLEGLRLTPISVNEILLGKMLYNLALLLVIEVIAFPLFIALFNFTIIGSVIDAFVVLTLGVIGLTVVGSFMSAVILGAKSKELILQIIVLPLLLPVIIPTVLSLREVMIYGTDLMEIPAARLILAYIIIMSTLSLLLFEYVMEE